MLRVQVTLRGVLWCGRLSRVRSHCMLHIPRPHTLCLSACVHHVGGQFHSCVHGLECLVGCQVLAHMTEDEREAPAQRINAAMALALLVSNTGASLRAVDPACHLGEHIMTAVRRLPSVATCP